MSTVKCSYKFRCRKRDVSSHEAIQAVHTPLSASSPSYFDMPPAKILPQRSPTVLRPLSADFSDLDIPYGTLAESVPVEEAGYLPRTHSVNSDMDTISYSQRRHYRSSTGTESGIPSLINTPSSSMGSYRALPPKRDPLTVQCSSKTIDLVIPKYPATAPFSPKQSETGSTSSASTITAMRNAQHSEMSLGK
jgi:hypothetical protein